MVQYLSGNVQFAPAAIDRRIAAKINIKVSTLRDRYHTKILWKLFRRTLKRSPA
ncbi:hypothetical protein [Microcoleus vaginatus]|uniref:hypothetical protein n=1 Tax=Microcoleus vaginatus TaxID=119532 RepID=UPI00403FBBA2